MKRIFVWQSEHQWARGRCALTDGALRHADSAVEMLAAALHGVAGVVCLTFPPGGLSRLSSGEKAGILSLAFHATVVFGGVCSTHSGGHWCSARILDLLGYGFIYYA